MFWRVHFWKSFRPRRYNSYAGPLLVERLSNRRSSRLADAAFQERVHAKSLSKLPRVHARSAKREARRPRRDVKTADFSQEVENLFCYTVAKICLVTFRAKIDERQYVYGENTFFLLLCGRADFCNAGGRRFRVIALHIDGVETDSTNTFQGSLA